MRCGYCSRGMRNAYKMWSENKSELGSWRNMTHGYILQPFMNMAMIFLGFVTPCIFDHLICFSRKHVNVFPFSDMDEIVLGY